MKTKTKIIEKYIEWVIELTCHCSTCKAANTLGALCETGQKRAFEELKGAYLAVITN